MVQEEQSKVSFSDVPDVLTNRDLAKILPLSEVYIRRLMARGELPGKKFRGSWICLKADLLLYLQSLPSANWQRRLG